MNARLSAEERRLIDEAVAQGRVTKLRPGETARDAEWQWCPKSRSLIEKSIAHLPPSQRRKASLRLAHERQAQSYRDAVYSGRVAPSKKRLSHAEVKKRRQKVMALKAQGLTTIQIAQELNLTHRRVRDDIRRASVTSRRAEQ